MSHKCVEARMLIINVLFFKADNNPKEGACVWADLYRLLLSIAIPQDSTTATRI